MLPINLDTFKVQQEELYRQAEMCRLAKSVKKPSRPLVNIYAAVGRVLVHSGQRLLRRAQAAY